MSKIADYFATDWSAMTTQDWIGLLMTVGVFIGLVVAFIYALRPSKRQYLEEQKFKILKDD